MLIVGLATTFATYATAQEDEDEAQQEEQKQAKEDRPDYARKGWYVGVGVSGGVYTQLEDDVKDEVRDALGLDTNFDADTAIGVNLLTGYRTTPNIAIELELEIMPSSDISIDGDVKFGEIETYAVTTNVKFFALTGRIQPFILVGLGLTHTEIEDSLGLRFDETKTSFAARVGGGLEVYLTEQVAIWGRTTYVRSESDIDGIDIDYVGFGGGIQYRF